MKKALKNPLCLALDFFEKDKSLKVLEEVKPHIGGVKLGPCLSIKEDKDFVSNLSRDCYVFLDLKLLDTFENMEMAIRAAFQMGVDFINIQPFLDKQVLKKLGDLEKELNKKRFFKIVCETFVSSYHIDGFSFLLNADISTRVDELKKLVTSCIDGGLSSFVCPAPILGMMNEEFSSHFFIAPGIRFLGDKVGGQKKIMGPHEAMEKGANVIVVGQPIYNSEDPARSAKEYSEAIKEFL